MQAATNRLEFAPPATPGLLRALLLAMLAHGLLVAALTWGVQWKREAQVISAEAELWAAVPQEAAPKLQELPPEPVVPAPVQAAPETTPEPPPVAEPPKVDIALEQEKKRIQKQQDKQREKLKQDKLKAEQLKADKLKLAKAAQADTAKQDALDKKKTEFEAKQLQAQRDKQLQRIAGLAGASGAPSSGGTALKSAGPSANYAGRIRARIKPNIVFTEEITGNPTALVEVRTSPDGTIIARKLLKSSGVKAWDDAVLRAIDKAEVLPRDTDGRVPSPLEISFQPKD
jgi:colicin import membrane protein